MKAVFPNKEYRIIIIPLLILPVWYLLYHYLQPITNWLVYDVADMAKGTRLTEAIRFFVFEFPKVLMLLALIIFFVGIIRSYFSPERTRKILEGKSIYRQYIGKPSGYCYPVLLMFRYSFIFRFCRIGGPFGCYLLILNCSPYDK
jgi:uncharacterized membrane protein YraQ (UPF0718 family)